MVGLQLLQHRLRDTEIAGHNQDARDSLHDLNLLEWRVADQAKGYFLFITLLIAVPVILVLSRDVLNVSVQLLCNAASELAVVAKLDLNDLKSVAIGSWLNLPKREQVYSRALTAREHYLAVNDDEVLPSSVVAYQHLLGGDFLAVVPSPNPGAEIIEISLLEERAK